MVRIDKSKPIMVTGATGYVAGWLVRKLLEEGLTVHAAVRNPDDKNKTGFLDELAAESPGKIRFFKSDLLVEGSYAEVMAGCELIYHTASPFSTSTKDPQKDVIEPALFGTRNVLEQANKTDSVKRVVLTSSVAAIYGDNVDIEQTPNGVFTEENWNTSSSPEHQAYSYSKLLAEKEAWKIHEGQSRWDLVVINPSFVIGPALNPRAVTSESYTIFKQFGDGSLKFGVPRLGMGIVDVRDVAFAHFKAGYTPEAKGRHIVSGHNTSFFEMAQTLLPAYGDSYPLPRWETPKWLVWLVGPIINPALTKKYVSHNVGHMWTGDNSKSKQTLGVTYRPLADSMRETFQQMIDEKLF